MRLTLRFVTIELENRYGAPPQWRRPMTVGLTGLMGVIAMSWLIWTAAFHSTPDVSSELIAFDVTSDDETVATMQVKLRDGVAATCRVRAYAEDHTSVGELAFTPVDGNNDVVVRTERRATTIEKLGCTAPGQPRPR